MNIAKAGSEDQNNTPKDIQIIQKMLLNSGIKEYEKSCVNYISEFLNSYVTDILTEAKKNMTYSNRNKISIDDVKLAVKQKQDIIYLNKPNINELKKTAEVINKIPLPDIPDTTNLLYPPIDNNLLKNNFQIYSDDIKKAVAEKDKKFFESNSSIRPDDLFLTTKRKAVFSENKSHIKNIPRKKQRKLSLSQAFKKSSIDKEKNNIEMLDVDESKNNNNLSAMNDNNINLDDENEDNNNLYDGDDGNLLADEEDVFNGFND